jgi:hypothetical protein
LVCGHSNQVRYLCITSVSTVSLHLLPDEVEPQFDSLAKKAVAFFKISRNL